MPPDEQSPVDWRDNIGPNAKVAFIINTAVNAVRDGALPVEYPNAQEIQDRFGEVAPLVVSYQTRTIIAGALLEGVAFFATIIYLVQHDPIALGIAGLLVLGLIAQTPTKQRMIAYVERGLSKAKGVMG